MGYHLTTADDVETRYSPSSTPSAKYTLCTRKPAWGPIFKWVLSTKYTDPETGLLYFGQRFLQPETGRWLSRDPIEESGGINNYGFVGENPISWFDAIGLSWTVSRNGDSRANAECDCDDTVGDLAKQIRLDPSEFTKWLVDKDSKGLPTASSTKMKEHRIFSIPNTVHITQGNLTASLGSPIMSIVATRKDGYKAGYVAAKYKIEDHFTAGETGNSGAEFSSWLNNDPNIYVWAHFGHGAKGSIYITDTGSTTAHLYIVTTSHHKLSEVLLFACEAGQNKDKWQKLVAPRGFLWANPGSINPTMMGWPWLYPYWTVFPWPW